MLPRQEEVARFTCQADRALLAAVKRGRVLFGKWDGESDARWINLRIHNDYGTMALSVRHTTSVPFGHVIYKLSLRLWSAAKLLIPLPWAFTNGTNG